jgi:hypothetical protein
MTTKILKVRKPGLYMRTRILMQRIVNDVAWFGGALALIVLMGLWLFDPAFSQKEYQYWTLVLIGFVAELGVLWWLIEYAGPSTKAAKRMMQMVREGIYELEVDTVASEIRAPFSSIDASPETSSSLRLHH